MNKNRVIIILSILLGISLLTTGIIIGKNYFSKSEETNIIDNNSNTPKKVEDNTTTTTTIKPASTKQATLSTKDKTVIKELETIESETVKSLNKEDKETSGAKAKGVFIKLVDFLFYDGEIKGVTFDQLTDSGKQKVLKLVHSIDEKIEAKYPGYKDSISTKASDALNKASELIKAGAEKISAFSKEKLGEKNYNNFIEAKNELIEYTKKAGSILKNAGSDLVNKAKTWYEKFREN